MRRQFQKIYGPLHDAVLSGLRRSPIPARFFGPPKGMIADLKTWIGEKSGSTNSEGTRGYDYRTIMPARQFACAAPTLIGPPLAEYVGDHETGERESFVARLPRARVFMRTGVVITEDDQVVEESCCWGRDSLDSDMELNSLRPLVKCTRLSGEYLTIVSRGWTNYYHWLTECLTRLCVAESCGPLPILLPRGMTDWHRESLKLMGVNEDRWQLVDDGCYEVDRLCFPSFPGWLGRMAEWAIRGVGEKITNEVKKAGGKRLYVGREGVKYRRVVNEPAILTRLHAAGFESVSGHALDFRTEVETFANADVIIGVHGAGMANLIFARPGTKVIEILDPLHAVPSYYNLSIRLGHDYSYMFADNCATLEKAPSQKGYDDLQIPLDRLEAALRSVSGGD